LKNIEKLEIKSGNKLRENIIEIIKKSKNENEILNYTVPKDSEDFKLQLVRPISIFRIELETKEELEKLMESRKK
jgi:hypothetical protein